MAGIFKAYDVRGKYPDELNEENAFKVGSAFGKLMKGDKIIIGMDARESSPSLKDSVIKGLYGEGKRIVDIGLCNTPMLYFAVINLKADGGVMISASHNPPEFNGIKMVKNFNGNILQIGDDSGMKDIEKLAKEIEVKEVEPEVEKTSILNDYLNEILKKLNKKSGLKIIVDYGNGVGSISAKPFFERTGFKVISLYSEPKPDFPNHVPNPHEEKNFNDLIKEVKKSKADLGIFFDGDADRAIPVDENGVILRGDILIGILALDILKQSKEKNIFYDLRCTHSLPEEIKKAGGNPIAMKVGNPYYKEKLINEGGVLGAETSGHMMYKEHYCIDDGLYATVKLINIMLNTGKKLSELSSPFMKYFKTYEINIKTENKEEKLKMIEKTYSKQGAKISKIDGITAEFNDWWFNVRPSNTEDLLRLNLEANTKKLMEEKVKEIENIINT